MLSGEGPRPTRRLAVLGRLVVVALSMLRAVVLVALVLRDDEGSL